VYSTRNVALARRLLFHFDPRATRMRWIPTTNQNVNDSTCCAVYSLAQTVPRPSLAWEDVCIEWRMAIQHSPCQHHDPPPSLPWAKQQHSACSVLAALARSHCSP
jgi:hypothetical protein